MDSSSTADPSSPGLGITGGYTGDSLALKTCIAFFLGMAMYNAVEVLLLIFFTFTRYNGLYFWSLIIASTGIIPYSLGFLFKFFSITTGNARWFAIFLLTIGWYAMISGQSVVLWSRLHLIVSGERGDKILKYTKWMIIIDALVLSIPTSVLTIGSNQESNQAVFVRGYNIMEKIQMAGFFIQELILSGIYIFETLRILNFSVQPRTRRLIRQLLAINVLIVLLDLALLGLECASLYILETTTKALFYSIKLKLEFAILSKLVEFVGKPQDNSANERRQSVVFTGSNSSQGGGVSRNGSAGGFGTDADVDGGNNKAQNGHWFRSSSHKSCDRELSPKQTRSKTENSAVNVNDFVDVDRYGSAHTHVTVETDHTTPNGAPAGKPTRYSTRPGVTDSDLDLAMLEHSETYTREDIGNINGVARHTHTRPRPGGVFRTDVDSNDSFDKDVEKG